MIRKNGKRVNSMKKDATIMKYFMGDPGVMNLLNTPSIPVAPHNEKEYKVLLKELDRLIDIVGGNENHPFVREMETIGILIKNYEDEHYPMSEASGVDVLKYLMEEHGLKQSDLPEIGTQGVVSEILNGKRELNTRQVKELSKRFSVSPAVFL